MRINKDIYSRLYFVTFIVVTLYLFRYYTYIEIYFNKTWFLGYVALFMSAPLFIVSLRRYKSEHSLLLFICALLVLTVGVNSGQLKSLWLTFVLAIGAKGIPCRSIIKVHFTLILGLCLMNVIGDAMGFSHSNVAVVNRTNVFDLAFKRRDFGYGWATDFANHVIFILLDYMLIRNGMLRLLEYVVYIAMGWVCIAFCDARLAAICIVFLIVCSIYVRLFNNREWHLSKLKSFFLIYGILGFAVIAIGVTMLFNSSNLTWLAIDYVLSGRLHFGQDFIHDAGFSFFGQDYKLYGMRDMDKIGSEYNYVDSSFVQFIIKWGIVLFTLLILAFIRIGERAYKRNDVNMLLMLFTACITGLICQFLFKIVYSVWPLLIFARMERSSNMSTNLEQIKKLLKIHKNDNRNTYITISH